jgi:hypothetical protein
MKIKLIDINWEDMKSPDLYGWLHTIRNSDVQLLRLRFSNLPWTSLLLCAPQGFVLGMHDKLLSSTHQRWMNALVTPESIRNIFVKEHSVHDVNLSRIPLGFYAYGSGDSSEPDSSRIGKDSLPLPNLWFEPFLVPQTDECEDIIFGRLQNAIDSLGWFFLRPERDIESTIDQLFDAPTSNFQATISDLANAIASEEKGMPIDKESLSYQMTFYGRCPFPLWSADGERISSLRARLVRLTGWPLFFDWAAKGLAEARTFYGSRPPSSSLPCSIIEELGAYLKNCHKHYPVLFEDPFTKAWKMRRMQTGK